MGRDARDEYDAGHIPGAVFFDQDAIVNASSTLPHALPSPEFFAERVGALGISDTDTIIVCDGPGFFSAPRVWWMFRTMGARDVRVLDGGIDNWKAQNRPVTETATTRKPTHFNVNYKANAIATLNDMKNHVSRQDIQIADARGPGRFTGDQPEPRPGMRSGHMPGAKNIPFMQLSENGFFKNQTSLRDALQSAGVDPDKPTVTTCGSGVTAAVITLALASLGNEDTKLYDGSWSEWGALENTPIETGN